MEKTETYKKIRAAIDKAYKTACEELEKVGVKYDSASCDDCIFVDDPEAKKTYAINIWEKECAEYEGD